MISNAPLALLTLAMSKHHQIDFFIIFLMILHGKIGLCRANQIGSAFVRKCCPLKFEYTNKKMCVTSERDFENASEKLFNSEFEYRFGHDCPNDMIQTPLTTVDDAVSFTITSHGDLKVDSRSPLENHSIVVTNEEYCLDFLSNENSGLVAVLCIESDETLIYEMLFGMIISMPFLLVTFLVYALLPDRNLHQIALMFYVLSLLIAYILLVSINLASNIPAVFWCKFLGYCTLFFFMVSFFWMNVICFDIWYTFSGGRGFVGSKRSSERRRIRFYFLYANGVPLLIVLMTYGIQEAVSTESTHNPGIGISRCFLATGWASLWYFYLEAGLVVIANITFFILTALRIRKVKKETSMLNQTDSKRHNYEKDKQKFNLYVKLLFAMGVNWSMEVISWLVNWNTSNKYQYVWYATDFFNAVYGVFIFFIFVFKKKIWTLLRRRYYNFVGKPHLAHTVTSSNTRSSHYSSTNYSTAESDRPSAVNGRQPAEEMALRRVT